MTDEPTEGQQIESQPTQAVTTTVPLADISAGAALAGVLMAPGETFKRIVEKPWWFALVPIVFLALINMGSGFLLFQKVDMKEVIQKQIMKSSRSGDLSSAQVEQNAEMGAKIAKFMTFAAPVTMTIFVALLACIFWLVLLAFGYDISFGRSWQATAWAFLPTFLTGIIFVVLLFIKDSASIDIENPIATNIAALLDKESIPKPLYVLLSAIDVFKVWVITLLGIGLGAAGRCRTRSALTAILILFAILVAIKMGLALIFG